MVSSGRAGKALNLKAGRDVVSAYCKSGPERLDRNGIGPERP